MTREEMTPEWVRKEIEEVSSWGQFSISFDCKHYLSLLTALEEARKEAEKYRDLLYPASEMSEDGIEHPTHYVVRLPWERPNPETPRGE